MKSMVMMFGNLFNLSDEEMLKYLKATSMDDIPEEFRSGVLAMHGAKKDYAIYTGVDKKQSDKERDDLLNSSVTNWVKHLKDAKG